MFGSDKNASSKQPVECLGIKFPNDEARRQYFIEKLREKLKDPAFRKIEGFPVGDDEDILALSDPPYYTACPNPFLLEIVSSTQKGKNSSYSCIPFAADVSEGKTDALYNAHSYHTKVPPRAVARYLLWFTKPGDVVLDSYCGSGMSGVAADMCASPARDFKESIEKEWESLGQARVKWGRRLCILNDLSPAATFIASNFVHDRNPDVVSDEVLSALALAEDKYGWVYETNHNGWPAGERKPEKWKNRSSFAEKGNIVFVIWSEILTCSNCGGEVNLWQHGLDPKKAAVKEKIICPRCGSACKKLELERREESVWDEMLGATIVRNKFVPAFIIYDVDGKRFEKLPDPDDLRIAADAEGAKYRSPIDAVRMMNRDGIWGNMHRAGYHRGVSHVHHFFTRRNWLIFALLWKAVPSHGGRFVLTSLVNRLSRMSSLHMKNFFNGGGGFAAGNTKGNLYFPSFFIEQSPFEYLPERTKRASVALRNRDSGPAALVTTGSAAQLPLKDESVDYVFIDPPFGQNLIYSELNFIWESFLGVYTNVDSEAIVDGFRSKDVLFYQQAMRRGFGEVYRVLKPGRWVTVEFHNSQNSIWMAIQEAIVSVGFVIADVRVLDKQQGSHKQNVSLGAVKKDLVISAYKPREELEQAFRLSAGTETGVWTFVENHLRQLPVFVASDSRAEFVTERFNYLLFDRMVAFHVQHRVSVPISAAEFYAGLRERFPVREGMFFLPGQAPEYDRQRLEVAETKQLELFVTDERTAIQWVRQQLTTQPMTYQELQPIYMREAQKVWDEHERPIELQTLLEQNFVLGTDGKWSVADPNNEVHLEQLRHRTLLKEFQQYLDTKNKLKVVRTEALRAGFKECWQKKDYMTIIQMAKRVPEDVIHEDAALLMYFDNALLLVGE